MLLLLLWQRTLHIKIDCSCKNISSIGVFVARQHLYGPIREFVLQMSFIYLLYYISSTKWYIQIDHFLNSQFIKDLETVRQ